MTNEEKILARLDELTEEVREAKRAIRPYVELKQDMEPLINSMVIESISRLNGLDKRVELEDVADMVGQMLSSSKNLTEAMKALDRVIEFKQDFAPYSKDLFKELVAQLQTTLNGFEGEDLKELLKQFVVNMGNLAESMKMLGSLMEMKSDAGSLSTLAFNDLVERLECLKQRGVFEAFETMIGVTERVGMKMQTLDLNATEPVRGIFGMLAALKRPEVQEGLGVLIELSTVMPALKQDAASRGCAT
ncbi:MAG: hypothetical protein DSY50_05265 [Desulfobulbus sp.]|nr:MAG: hypothetical protein DSY50_05265 [Desulfobulbus sp.]RUM40364.1 MAG: hypothetical protein DSY70_03715 [Desulfobulbus sp.]